MDEIPIDHDIPLPQEFGRIARAVRSLRVGDSFLVHSHQDLTSAYTAAKKAGITIKSEKKKDSQERRVWRKK